MVNSRSWMNQGISKQILELPSNVETNKDCPAKSANKEGHQPFLLPQKGHIQVVKLVVELKIWQ